MWRCGYFAEPCRTVCPLRRTSTRLVVRGAFFLRPDVKAPTFSRDKDERDIVYIHIYREKERLEILKGPYLFNRS